MVEPRRFTRSERLHFLRDLLERENIASQSEIADRLVERGIEATQSNVSRDLREVGAVKIAGAYRIPDAGSAHTTTLERVLVEARVHPAAVGTHQLVLHTEDGEAGRVARTIDAAELPGVVGTIAGRDTVLVICRTRRDQLQLEETLSGHRHR